MLRRVEITEKNNDMNALYTTAFPKQEQMPLSLLFRAVKKGTARFDT